MSTRRHNRQRLLGCIFACLALTVWGEGTTLERSTVKLTDASRPSTVKVRVLNGSISVKGYEGKEVVVETDQRGLEVEESSNEVTIVQPGSIGPVDLRVSVPLKTSLQLKCTNGGNIQVEKVEGEIEADGANASITLRKISGVVIAHSLQGRIVAQLDKVTSGKPMSFSAMNGNIELSLPGDTRAEVKLQTLNGTIETDFPITLSAESLHTVGKRIAGKINGGGAEIQLKTLNGDIQLRTLKQSEP